VLTQGANDVVGGAVRPEVGGEGVHVRPVAPPATDRIALD
jgi:hypothetical protein